MRTVVVQSWPELMDQLFEGSWNGQLQRFRSNFAYRGVSDARMNLLTSLQRLGGHYHNLETDLLRNFRKYSCHNGTLWQTVSLAAHHGLPTRLLDWTFSPLVALHFMTAYPAPKADGVLWVVDFMATNRHLPPRLQEVLSHEGSNVFTTDLLSHAATSLHELDTLAPDPFVLFLEPPSLDERVINQYALFSLMSSTQARLDTWLEEHPDSGYKLVVPAALKWEVRDKLDQCNVNERVLFPGLDGLCLWLRRYYSPRGA